MQSKATLKPDSTESVVIEANVQFYRQIAAKYDRYETCASNPDLQQMLDRDVDHIGTVLGPRGRPIECLDCGGGTGNLTLRMLRKGWSITVVDVSSEMLAILRKKAGREGYSPRLINNSFSDFLTRGGKSYDVIAFSSVLHHLYEYLPSVALAADHIEKGGLFYCAFDPVISAHPRAAQYFEAFDTLLAKVSNDQRDLLPGIARRLRKVLHHARDPQHAHAVPSVGDLAEYHARKGIDDRAIVRLLRDRGFSLIEYSRWAFGRTAPARLINSRLHLTESFKLMAQRST